MATAAVIGLPGGSKRLLSTPFCPSDLSEKLFFSSDHFPGQFSIAPASAAAAGGGKNLNLISAKKTPELGRSAAHRSTQTRAVKAPEENAGRAALSAVPTTASSPFPPSFSSGPPDEDEDKEAELPLELLLLLQKSLLEKQWKLSSETARRQSGDIVRSGVSARLRRTISRSPRCSNQRAAGKRKQQLEDDAGGLLQIRPRGYIRGAVSDSLLDHAQVVSLSKKIKAGILLEEQKSKLQERLGSAPTDAQVASSLRMSSSEMQARMMESRLAREKLAMSNVRLVLSVAQKYDGMGAELDDLVQGGLIGLLRGIEKFDSSKGCKISTYVYWWIRQGVSRALVDNSRILRLPPHLHGRLFSIRSARTRLQERGIPPSIEKIAECMNTSTKKVKNAMEAVSKVLSLDREAFPSLDGLPGGDTLHSYVAFEQPESSPWSIVQEQSLKGEVNELLCSTLSQREREIVQLYYGLEKEPLTWEAIGRRFGLSRERVRQVGLQAVEKLRREARRRGLQAMLR